MEESAEPPKEETGKCPACLRCIARVIDNKNYFHVGDSPAFRIWRRHLGKGCGERATTHQIDDAYYRKGESAIRENSVLKETIRILRKQLDAMAGRTNGNGKNGRN